MAIAGKSTLVKVSTVAGGAGAYNTVAEINDASMSIEGDNQDITAFGDSTIKRIQGLKDGSYSLSGFYKSDDTNGQVAILNALLNDTEIWAQFLPNGTAGWKQQVRVANFEVSSSVDGVCELSIELEGTGTISAV